MTGRSEEIGERLGSVRERIAAACRAAGREPDEVSLVVVTKFFPASDVRILADLGVTDVAENRHQEAVEKSAVCADLGLRWHFVGGLQSNKAAAVTGYASVVQSVDRAKLLRPLARGAAEQERMLDVLVQVSLDGPDSRHRSGVAPDGLAALADAVAAQDDLALRGVMAVAPLGDDAGDAFDRLAELHRSVLADHPDATWRSAGMSGDLEAAVARGATHVRVGSAVLGSRPPVQ
ncbi:MAG: YggS family pyridoxal phosphate-dependent enzyme [Nocardioides sp.]|uniref:YggS family pyridoxal phosphate-dependent enzyme n=1 Tax=Nocardioides sp. TaxID=35761 RepID=UPI00239D706C|nr:YggS family pyridoxal phosphate-dependent enzyme [Nocardioides sp.]MDE0778720.1 YggS family pyridoxal phosphate-dependent enzyme [Nocardioides sp.]